MTPRRCADAGCDRAIGTWNRSGYCAPHGRRSGARCSACRRVWIAAWNRSGVCAPCQRAGATP